MARTSGMISRDSNYEVSIKKPLDARSVVKTYQDLTIETNWQNASGYSIAYNGMTVAVVDTTDPSKNGLYLLFDKQCTSALKSPRVTEASCWTRIGDLDDEALASINQNSADIKANAAAINAEASRAQQAETDIITALTETDAKINSTIIPALTVATADKLGLIKSTISAVSNANKVTVNEDGTAEVTFINVNTLIQTDGDILKLDGGL